MLEEKKIEFFRELSRIKKIARKKHIEIPRVDLRFTKKDKKKYAKEMQEINKNAIQLQQEETESIKKRRILKKLQ